MSQNQSQDYYNVTRIKNGKNVAENITTVMIPMRDGIKLHAEIHLPEGLNKPAPVVLIASPYNRKGQVGGADEFFLKKGCIFINLSWRGTASSEGKFIPTHMSSTTDNTDLEDFFSWLEKQEFFNGSCVMYGGSYPGYTQWCAQKVHHKCLKAIAPRVAPIYSCKTPARPNGGVYIGTLNWVITMHHRTNFGYESVPDYNGLNFNYHLPFIDADRMVYKEDVLSYKAYVSSSHNPAQMLTGYEKDFAAFETPAFIVGAWFDPFKHEVLETYQMMKKTAATDRARKFTRLTMGPWGHGNLENPDIFGAENDQTETDERQRRFLTGLLDDPMKDPLPDETLPVHYFMMGDNSWHYSAQWPPENVQEKSLFLHSGGHANSCKGDGVLSWEKPLADEKPDTYVSDPANPVSPSAGAHAPKACYDRLFLEERSDILVYTTEKFTEPLAMTGKYKLRFSASVTTKDTDFFATLTLLTPEGKSLLATSGMIRSRYRNGLEKEEFLTPGEIYSFEIDMGDVALKVLPGYALRLEICGQDFPHYDRNANSGEKPFTDKVLYTSTATIYHDKDHAAELILPVNPAL